MNTLNNIQTELDELDRFHMENRRKLAEQLEAEQEKARIANEKLEDAARFERRQDAAHTAKELLKTSSEIDQCLARLFKLLVVRRDYSREIRALDPDAAKQFGNTAEHTRGPAGALHHAGVGSFLGIRIESSRAMVDYDQQYFGNLANEYKAEKLDKAHTRNKGRAA